MKKLRLCIKIKTFPKKLNSTKNKIILDSAYITLTNALDDIIPEMSQRITQKQIRCN